MSQMLTLFDIFAVVIMFVLVFIAGWLLDITKLILGENIGEGEFGGEFCFFTP